MGCRLVRCPSRLSIVHQSRRAVRGFAGAKRANLMLWHKTRACHTVARSDSGKYEVGSRMHRQRGKVQRAIMMELGEIALMRQPPIAYRHVGNHDATRPNLFYITLLDKVIRYPIFYPGQSYRKYVTTPFCQTLDCQISDIRNLKTHRLHDFRLCISRSSCTFLVLRKIHYNPLPLLL